MFLVIILVLFALEHPEKYQFIILISDTQFQASRLIRNLQQELEENELLRRDYGDKNVRTHNDWSLKGDEWQKTNLVLGNGVRIVSRSYASTTAIFLQLFG